MARTYKLEERLAGLRLLDGIAEIFPGLGVRARKRLLAQATLNGKPANPFGRIKPGDALVVPEIEKSLLPWEPFVTAKTQDYCFFAKPPGLHSVSVAGSAADSLEARSAHLLGNERPLFLQRLDHQTSGLLTAAFNAEAAMRFRSWEDQGKAHKYYLAFLEGALAQPLLAQSALDTRKRQKTRVLARTGSNVNFTRITPLYSWQGHCPFIMKDTAANATLALCHINKGKRHQIRAHAASLGYPLYGDGLYGSSGSGYILEHFALVFPGHEIVFAGAHSLLSRLEPGLAAKALNLINAGNALS